jgi:hypothetical protein
MRSTRRLITPKIPKNSGIWHIGDILLLVDTLDLPFWCDRYEEDFDEIDVIDDEEGLLGYA